MTLEGEEPMVETEDNLYDIGKHVEEPTQEELGDAIGSIQGVLWVVPTVYESNFADLDSVL